MSPQLWACATADELPPSFSYCQLSLDFLPLPGRICLLRIFPSCLQTAMSFYVYLLPVKCSLGREGRPVPTVALLKVPTGHGSHARFPHSPLLVLTLGPTNGIQVSLSLKNPSRRAAGMAGPQKALKGKQFI